MTEVTNLMSKLADRLFDNSSERNAFLESLVTPSLTPRSSIIWTKPELQENADILDQIDSSNQPEWLPKHSVSILKPGCLPGKSAAFEAGAIYPLDYSSILTASAMLALKGSKSRILDVCAAPGGKTLFASVLLQPDFLLSNEIIRKRLGILRFNLKKTGRPNVFTQAMEAYELAEVAPDCFDLAIVDAPCSGQSLLAKGTENPGCFHPNIVKGNARRQLRILSQAAGCVSPEGYLFYSTCTFAPKENEEVIRKFLARSPEFTTQEVPHLEKLSRSKLSDEFCYRIYPHQHRCAGGFVCLLKREGESAPPPDIPPALREYPISQDR